MLADTAAVRRERFGGLVYDFATRRLSFLKTEKLLETVERLADEPSARAACFAAGVGAGELPVYARALDDLAARGMIVARNPG